MSARTTPVTDHDRLVTATFIRCGEAIGAKNLSDHNITLACALSTTLAAQGCPLVFDDDFPHPCTPWHTPARLPFPHAAAAANHRFPTAPPGRAHQATPQPDDGRPLLASVPGLTPGVDLVVPGPAAPVWAGAPSCAEPTEGAMDHAA